MQLQRVQAEQFLQFLESLHATPVFYPKVKVTSHGEQIR
jgi:hypothetical protein